MRLEDLSPRDYVYDESNDTVYSVASLEDDYCTEGKLYRAYPKDLKLNSDEILELILEWLEINDGYKDFEQDALDSISDNTKLMFKAVIKQIEKELPQLFTILEDQIIDC